MSAPEALYQLFFELSHEHRHAMLLLLHEQPLRITDLAKAMELHHPEVHRHLARLQAVQLIDRDVDGFYRLSPFGELVLTQLTELEFTTRFLQYFASHPVISLPAALLRRLSDLSRSTFTKNLVDFLYQIELIIKESTQYVWMSVPQCPVTVLATILGALDRGVELRIIEQEDRVAGPHLTVLDEDGAQALRRVRSTPLIEQRILPRVDVIILLTDNMCAVAFPNQVGTFDYQGFVAADDDARTWCRDLFLHVWESAEPLVYLSPTHALRPLPLQAAAPLTPRRITVTGHNDATVDVQAVQDAVDLFDDVTLTGTFNFGPSSVQISRSVVVRGEETADASAGATLYKSGWLFPFTEFDAVFKVDGEDAEVTLENLHFTDFNHTCIWGSRCRRLTIRHNTITLRTGYGRGMSFGAFGDVIIGILICEPHFHPFTGHVTIDGNTIDFATGGAWGGFLSRGGLEDSPEYRPDLLHHEYYMTFGVAVHQSSSTVRIEKNVIRNANARGIAATGNFASADVQILENVVTSDVYGSYPFASPEAGAGILVQSAWGVPSPGFKVTIEANTIEADKLNYSGIIALGPVTDREGAGKLTGGIIRLNRIRLTAGYEGIHVRKCDRFQVYRNTLLGDMYYGLHLSGRKPSNRLDLRALNNVVEGNDMTALRIRDPDEYSNHHADGRLFAPSHGGSVTAHVWLDVNTKDNRIHVSSLEHVVDHGQENTLQYM